jgi:hypothetical protein
MRKSTAVLPRKRGRPPTGVDRRDPVTAIRLSAELRDAIDAASAERDDRPGRSELIRQIVTGWLRRKGYLKAQ